MLDGGTANKRAVVCCMCRQLLNRDTVTVPVRGPWLSHKCVGDKVSRAGAYILQGASKEVALRELEDKATSFCKLLGSHTHGVDLGPAIIT